MVEKFVCRRCMRELPSNRLADPHREEGRGLCKECHRDEKGGTWGLRGGFTNGKASVEPFDIEDLSLTSTDHATEESGSSKELIKVTDRNGETQRFPKIERRTEAGERFRLCEHIYRYWGPEVGEADVNSAVYQQGDENFPNEWVGQTESDPVPSLEDAQSPKAYFYRMFSARGENSPGTRAQQAYEQTHEHDIEAYRANFPQALHPEDLQTELVTIREDSRPWEDFQIPPEWAKRFEENGGVPPLKRASVDSNDEEGLSRSEAEGYLETLHNADILNALEYELLKNRIDSQLN